MEFPKDIIILEVKEISITIPKDIIYFSDSNEYIKALRAFKFDCIFHRGKQFWAICPEFAYVLE